MCVLFQWLGGGLYFFLEKILFPLEFVCVFFFTMNGKKVGSCVRQTVHTLSCTMHFAFSYFFPQEEIMCVCACVCVCLFACV